MEEPQGGRLNTGEDLLYGFIGSRKVLINDGSSFTSNLATKPNKTLARERERFQTKSLQFQHESSPSTHHKLLTQTPSRTIFHTSTDWWSTDTSNATPPLPRSKPSVPSSTFPTRIPSDRHDIGTAACCPHDARQTAAELVLSNRSFAC